MEDIKTYLLDQIAALDGQINALRVQRRRLEILLFSAADEEDWADLGRESVKIQTGISPD